MSSYTTYSVSLQPGFQMGTSKPLKIRVKTLRESFKFFQDLCILWHPFEPQCIIKQRFGDPPRLNQL